MKKILFTGILFLFLTGINFAQSPDWTADPYKYSNSMTITSAIILDDIEVFNLENKIGAFVGEECRGVAEPVMIDLVNHAIFYLTVYGESTEDSVQFKIYNASSGNTIDVETQIMFKPDKSLGIAAAPYYFSNPTYIGTAEIISFTIPGQEGETKISEENEITVLMPAGTDVSNLIPEFELSNFALARVSTFIQTSEETEQDYTNPVQYAIHAINESDTVNYTIIVIAGDKTDFKATNTISPNGDGINDFWIVENVELYRNCTFRIFDYHNEIYKRTGYENDWYETYQGKELPLGTYYYTVQCPDCADCADCKIAGYICIIK